MYHQHHVCIVALLSSTKNIQLVLPQHSAPRLANTPQAIAFRAYRQSESDLSPSSYSASIAAVGDHVSDLLGAFLVCAETCSEPDMALACDQAMARVAKEIFRMPAGTRQVGNLLNFTCQISHLVGTYHQPTAVYY